jgi:hypothetical protein
MTKLLSVQAQLLFLESADALKISNLLELSGGSVYAGLGIMTRCNTSSQMLLQFVPVWLLQWERFAMCRC